MNHVATLFPSMERYTQNVSKKGANCRRSELIGLFKDNINPQRVGKLDKRGKPLRLLTDKAMGFMLSPFKEIDLDVLYKNCSQANHFSKLFWYSINAKTCDKMKV